MSAEGHTPDVAAHDRLIEAVALRRDREAFAELFSYFAPRLKAWLIKSGATAAAAEDFAQDAMLTVWRKADLFDARKARAATWIFTIARNRRLDMLRRDARPLPAPEIDLSDAGAQRPDDILSDDTLVKMLKDGGIDIARRTVAKYREAMHIASSVQRRREKQAAR